MIIIEFGKKINRMISRRKKMTALEFESLLTLIMFIIAAIAIGAGMLVLGLVMMN